MISERLQNWNESLDKIAMSSKVSGFKPCQQDVKILMDLRSGSMEAKGLESTREARKRSGNRETITWVVFNWQSTPTFASTVDWILLAKSWLPTGSEKSKNEQKWNKIVRIPNVNGPSGSRLLLIAFILVTQRLNNAILQNRRNKFDNAITRCFFLFLTGKCL